MRELKLKNWNPQLVIPNTFAECLTYEKQILFLQKEIETLQNELAKIKLQIDNN